MRQFLKRHNDLSHAYEYQHETAKFVVRHCEPSAGKNYILATILFKSRLITRIIINNNLCIFYAIISLLRNSEGKSTMNKISHAI